ncbi:MAG: glycosyltransferase family 39 protein [Candidatus Alcyoniella australis]|nr:glycosyltransferase family 39 protein [Candidatus Alcyoniella australis]
MATMPEPPRRLSQKRRERLMLLGIVAFAALLRAIFLAWMPNVFSQEGESYSRINLMLTWLGQGSSYPDTNFGPLHTWFVYAITLPFDNVVWPVRAVHAICGVLTVIPLFYMVRALYGTQTAAWSALYLGAFHVHLRASVTGLAEAPFVLCLFGGLCFAILALVQRRVPLRWIVLSALLLNLAGAFRFEAWLFLPPLCLMLLARSAPKAILFGALNLIFPLIHMGMCYRFASEPKTVLDALSFMRTSGTSFLQYMVHLPLSYRLWAWPQAFWIALTPPVAILALVGLVWSLARAVAAIRRRGRNLLLGVLPVLFLFNIAVFGMRAIKGTIDPAIYRYTLSMDLLLIPLAVYGVREGIAVLRAPRAWRGTLLAVVMLCCTGWTLAVALQQTRDNAYPDDVVAMVQWIHDNGGGQTIITDHDYHPYLMVQSGLPQGSFVNLIWTGELRNELDREFYERMWVESRPTLLILDHDCNPDIGGNCVVFDLPRQGSDAIEFEGRRFERAFAQGDYSIFRISYPDAGKDFEEDHGEQSADR